MSNQFDNSRAMQHPACELRRTHLLGTSVHKGMNKNRSLAAPVLLALTTSKSLPLRTHHAEAPLFRGANVRGVFSDHPHRVPPVGEGTGGPVGEPVLARVISESRGLYHSAVEVEHHVGGGQVGLDVRDLGDYARPAVRGRRSGAGRMGVTRGAEFGCQLGWSSSMSAVLVMLVFCVPSVLMVKTSGK